MKFSKTKVALNQLVADLSQASAALHQIHWYLRGRHFITWHERMDEYRDMVEAQLDEVAERLIIIDGAPYSTLEEFVAHTTLPSVKADYQNTLESNIQRVAEIFKALANSYAQGLVAAGEESDQVTEDLLIGFKAEIEKTIWMVHAELGMAPEIDA